MNADNKWTIKREVSVGDLVAFVLAFSSVIYAWTTLDKRLSIMEREYISVLKNSTRQDEEMNQLKRDIKDDLTRINDKLDRLVHVRLQAR